MIKTQLAALVAAAILITAAPATAFTWPGNILSLAEKLPAHSVVTQEPNRPEWPAQYQVRSFTHLVWQRMHVSHQCLVSVVQVLYIMVFGADIMAIFGAIC